MKRPEYKKIILVTNKVYHYRISIYNYFNTKFKEHGYELVAITNKVQKDNPHNIMFDLTVKPFNILAYTSFIRKLNPCAVITFLNMKNVIIWPLMCWLRMTGIYSIYWNHGVNLLDPDNRFKWRLFNILHSLADTILLYSDNERKYIAADNRKKIIIAPNTINYRDIPEIRESKKQLRARHSIQQDRVVLFVGRMNPCKRVEDLVHIAHLLNDNILVLLVGGPLPRNLKKTVEDAPNIRHIGPVYEPEKVNEYFKLSDVFCLPGSCGLAVNQAFFWGLPVVTQNVRHHPEIIYLEDGVNGFITDRSTPSLMADRINRLCSDENLLAEFGERAQKTFHDKASIDIMLEGFLSAIQKSREDAL